MVEENWSPVNAGEQVLEPGVGRHLALGHTVSRLDDSLAVRADICGP